MAILYLDVDDEITSAAARLRDAKERRIAFVLPAGSRLGTSRINFRLLAREAQLRGRSIAVVAPDAPTRSLAASAGLPTFATVFEYEESLTAPAGTAGSGDEGKPAQGGRAAGRQQDAGDAERGRGAAAAASSAAGGRGLGDRRGALQAPDADAARAGHGEPGTGGHSDRPGPRSAAAAASIASSGSRRGPGTGVVVLAAVIILVLIVGGVAAWLLLPSATVDVVARAETIGPFDLTVRADPAVTSADAANLVVPAQRDTFPLSVSDTFPATGKKVDETKAKGSVRWTNCDPTRSYQIPAGTSVRTRAGVAFTTDEAVFVAVATLTGNPPQITCQTRDVSVTAATAGTDGNVNAGDINVVPGTYNSVVVRVSNPAATSGGTHTETTVVDKKDVAAATKQLQTELTAKLQSDAAAPPNLPAGATAFADTASMANAAPSTDPNSLVDQAVDTFALGMTASGSVTIVDQRMVSDVATERVRSAVASGRDLVEGSVSVTLGDPVVVGQAVTFPVTASGRQIRRLDAGQLRSAIAGRSIDDARQLLSQYGDVTISTWPDWVSTIPTFDFRLDLRVSAEPAGSSRSPSSSGSPGSSGSTSPGPTASADASDAAGASGNPPGTSAPSAGAGATPAGTP